MVTIEGEALAEIMRRLDVRRSAGVEVTKISVDVRGPEHMAVKVNEGMWSATLNNV
jgi:class 3 adenylate cyclase